MCKCVAKAYIHSTQAPSDIRGALSTEVQATESFETLRYVLRTQIKTSGREASSPNS